MLDILKGERKGRSDTFGKLLSLYLTIDEACSHLHADDSEIDMERRDELVLIQSAIVLSASQMPARTLCDIVCKLELWRREALGSDVPAYDIGPTDRVVLSVMSDFELASRMPTVPDFQVRERARPELQH